MIGWVGVIAISPTILPNLCLKNKAYSNHQIDPSEVGMTNFGKDYFAPNYIILLQKAYVPYFFCLTADEPKRRSQNGEEYGLVPAVPKIFEIAGVEINKKKGDAKLTGNIITVF